MGTFVQIMVNVFVEHASANPLGQDMLVAVTKIQRIVEIATKIPQIKFVVVMENVIAENANAKMVMLENVVNYVLHVKVTVRF